MILDVKELKKSYPNGEASVEVLHGVNLSVNPGETVAIIGPSGSGKSTLLTLLSGLDRPTSGVIKLAGIDLASLDEEALAKYRAQKLGIIFQQFHLMGNLSALENIMLPLEIAGSSDARARAEQALVQVGLEHRFEHFPSKLSGGECQRVAIARAMVMQPALMLADEPSGNLDVETGDMVMKKLFEIINKSGGTLLLVTHNRELASWCNRRLVLHRGLLHEAQEVLGSEATP